MAKRVESWVVTDAFWERVKPLVPQRVRSPDNKVSAQTWRRAATEAGATGV